MRIIWKQWGQQRFSYWLNNKMNLSTDNSNIRVVTEFWFRFVFFFFFWQVLELAADVLKRVPEEIDYEQTAKIMSDEPSPLNVGLLQEVSDITYTKWYARKILRLWSTFTCARSTKLRLPDGWHHPEFRASSKIHSVRFTCSFNQWCFFDLLPGYVQDCILLRCVLLMISITKCPHSKKLARTRSYMKMTLGDAFHKEYASQ